MKRHALHPDPRQGASVAELLVLVAILAALLALLTPTFRGLMERSREVECVNRLRQVGVLYRQYAGEQPGGRVRIFQEGAEVGAHQWYVTLREYAGLSELQAKRQFGCPAFPADEVTSWACYGFRIAGSPGVVQKSGKGKLYELAVYNVPNPGAFFLAADSFSSHDHTQVFRLLPPGLYNSHAGIHLRHRGRANVLFLDGHVEAAGAARLGELGINRALDAAGEPIEIVTGF